MFQLHQQCNLVFKSLCSTFTNNRHHVIDLLTVKLQSSQANLIEKIALCVVISQQHKSNLSCSHVHLSNLLDFTDDIAFFGLRKCNISVSLVVFIVMLGQMVENVDPGWYFSGMSDYFHGF